MAHNTFPVVETAVAGLLGLGAGILLGRTVLAPKRVAAGGKPAIQPEAYGLPGSVAAMPTVYPPEGKWAGEDETFELPGKVERFRRVKGRDTETTDRRALEPDYDACVARFRSFPPETQASDMRMAGAPPWLVDNLLARRPGAVEAALIWMSQQGAAARIAWCRAYGTLYLRLEDLR